jgi:hypothetical protein
MRIAALCVFVLCVGMFLGGWLQGQDRKEPPDTKKPDTKVDEPKVKGQLPPGYKKLGLSEDQVQAIYRKQNEYHAKIEEHQKAITALKAELKVEEEKVLTKAQKDRLKELRDKDSTKEPEKDKAPEKDKTTEKDKPPTKDKEPAKDK